MAVSPLKLVQERARQDITGDVNFFKKMTYFFELRVPETAVPTNRNKFLIPLIIPPESYSMDEPFTLVATPTQNGGLYVEENGIVQRMIKLDGTTGFKPRPYPRGFTGAPVIPRDNRSYSRVLPVIAEAALSGHRHFQYLQDKVFRTYADLKRDPSTSEDTFLFFHNSKDDEHWLVAPQKFGLTRSSDKPVMYRYSIELLVVDKAEAVDADFSEEKGLLDKIKNAVSMIKSGLDLASGALNDLTALTAELSSFVKNFAVIIDNVTTIINAARNFANGVTALIQAPYALVTSTVEAIEAVGFAIQAFEDIETEITKFPETTKQKFKQMADGLDRIGTHPAAFETSSQRKMREIRQSQDLLASASTETIQAAEASSPPQSFSEVEALGTGVTPGDIESARSDLGIGQNVVQYTSAKQIPIEQGDTLVNLAARYLGDARLWQQIAVLNGLNPPFIDDLASTPLDSDEPVLAGVLGRGAKILIPSFAVPPERQPLLPVLGVQNEEDAETHLLGTDLALEIVGGREGSPLLDLVIDVARGSVDVKLVSGIANISQAIQSRILTDKGSDILFKRMGLDRMISLNITPVDLETAKFRFRECLNQDQRIAATRKLTFESGTEGISADTVAIDAEVELKGFSQNYTVRSAIGV